MAATVDFPNSYPNLSAYAVFSGVDVTNYGNSVITGNIGTIGSSINVVGFPPGVLSGQIDTNNSGNTTRALLAGPELTSLYNTIYGFRTLPSVTPLPPETNLTGPLAAGVYYGTTNIFVNGTLVLTGSATDQYFFIADSRIQFGLTTNVNISLGSVKAYNVFWLGKNGILHNGSATAPPLSQIQGIILGGSGGANQYIGSGATITGANYSLNSVIMDTNTVVLTLPCFLKGTQILTETGYIPIETIKIGDKIQTFAHIKPYNDIVEHESELETCTNVHMFKVLYPSKESGVICFTPGSLGANMPVSNLYLSPHHGVLVEGRLVLAKDLVNETTIYQDLSQTDIEYYHIELEKHAIMKAEDVLTESFV